LFRDGQFLTEIRGAQSYQVFAQARGRAGEFDPLRDEAVGPLGPPADTGSGLATHGPNC
jgi:hypothetical protein